MVVDLMAYLAKSLSVLVGILHSYRNASQDILYSLQFSVRRLSHTYAILQIKYFNETIISRSQYLSFEIKRFFTHDLFADQSSFSASQKNLSTCWASFRRGEAHGVGGRPPEGGAYPQRQLRILDL